VKRRERPPPSREMDDLALEALCDLLKDAQWDGEPWPTIIRRRLKNVYDAKLTGRSQWMYTHFHLRSLIESQDEDKAATHVARIWNRSKATILTHAKRLQAKEIAQQWIEASVLRDRQEFRFGNDRFHVADPDIYGMLDVTLTKLAQQFPADKKVKQHTAKSR
jgi:hypothetical protein